MSEPLALFLTWTCYGTWLHGDERGSVDDDHRVCGSPFKLQDTQRERDESRRLRNPPVALDAAARQIVHATIVAHCAYRRWVILALNVRSNHVHLVVEYGGVPPETMLAQFKAWTTRRLREARLFGPGAVIWTHHGSTRYLWNREGTKAAVEYVTDAQGVDLS